MPDTIVKTKNLLLFILITFCHVCLGQTKAPVDSAVIKKTDSLVRLAYRLWNEDLDSAEVIANYMLNYSEENDHLRGIGQAYGTFAMIYRTRGDDGQALAYHKKEALVFEELGHELFLANVRFNIGTILIDQKEYTEALSYMEKAHAYYLSVVGREADLKYSYHAIGFIYEKLNRPLVEVMKQFDEAEKLALINSDSLFLINISNGRGEAYLRNNLDVPTAISFFNKSILLIKRSRPNDHYYFGYTYNLLGKAFLASEQYQIALQYNDSALHEYETLGYSKGLKIAYEIRKNILASRGNYKDAYSAFEQFSAYRDTLYERDKLNEFRRLKTEYETERLEAEKETAEAQVKLAESTSKLNRNYLIAAIIIAILIALLAVFFLERLRARKRMEFIAMELKEAQKRLALEKQYRESELKALKSQMNPHFIFNALNSIQEYIVTNKKNEASNYLSQFADLIRTYLDHSDAGLISLSEEIESLTMYLDLEVMRFEDTLEYAINVSDSITQDHVLIPTMLIQPYVENAVKHGLLHKKNDKKLMVSFESVNSKILCCIIEDNGVGREKTYELQKNRSKWHKPFATKVTQERLDLLNQGRDEKIGVEIEDLTEGAEATGTRVTLTIPLANQVK